ncbi:hypothetical protein KUK86_004537 [Vibrio parahaemolyticus]|nr:hypothetical protein [Vibrio parahaemolyticus]
MTKDSANWKAEMPTESGLFLLDDLSGQIREVEIKNMKIDDNPDRPDNFHVFDGDDYYALSTENGCADWLWAKRLAD